MSVSSSKSGNAAMSGEASWKSGGRAGTHIWKAPAHALHPHAHWAAHVKSAGNDVFRILMRKAVALLELEVLPQELLVVGHLRGRSRPAVQTSAQADDMAR